MAKKVGEVKDCGFAQDLAERIRVAIEKDAGETAKRAVRDVVRDTRMEIDNKGHDGPLYLSLWNAGDSGCGEELLAGPLICDLIRALGDDHDSEELLILAKGLREVAKCAAERASALETRANELEARMVRKRATAG